MFSNIDLQVFPRKELSWIEFKKQTPKYSIALDGFVTQEPQYDSNSKHVNFDHHSGVERMATMSTAQQVFFGVKTGLMTTFREQSNVIPHSYVNDCDQDVALSVFILENYKLFENTNSIPIFNRLLDIDSKLDITAGSFPMNHNERLVRQHHWVFEPYTNLRKSGSLYSADEYVIRDNIESCCTRIMKYMNGDGGEAELDTRHKMLYQGENFWMVDEIGGSDARFKLYSLGMKAFINKIGKKENGNGVYSIGKTGNFIDFPVLGLFDYFNSIEGLSSKSGWGGSTTIGGSPREAGTTLSADELKNHALDYIAQVKK